MCQQLESKKGNKTFGFVIRFVQLTRMIERFFSVDSEAERDAWVKVGLCDEIIIIAISFTQMILNMNE
jgi:hypothetical protein